MTASASKQATSVARATAPSADMDLPPEPPETSPHRQAMIAEAAFFMARARGFEPGHELDDWLAAEREVDQRLSATEH